MKRVFLAIVTFIIGAVLGLYVGGWLLFIKPIITCCVAFDGGTLTALMISITIIKIICAGAVGSFIFWVFGAISTVIVGK